MEAGALPAGGTRREFALDFSKGVETESVNFAPKRSSAPPCGDSLPEFFSSVLARGDIGSDTDCDELAAFFWVGSYAGKLVTASLVR